MSETTGARALKVVGEVIAPGCSLGLDGNIKDGALHLTAGAVGAALFGPLAWFYAGANSYSNSVSGKHFHEHFFKSNS